jgi:predicted ATPase/DNA-binding XRE family transcriptional regulator
VVSGAELAAELRRLRSRAELTQEELAERAGISVRAVSDIERGVRRRIYPVTARQLAAALELPAAERSTFERTARGLPAASNPPSVLPVPRTAFFGRQRELGELSERLAADPPILVTVTGPGGVGKTRLALETVRACTADFAAVHWVQLGDVGDPSLVMATIARSVGAKPAELPLVLRVRRTLLVLDTFEHLLPAATELGALLDRCAGLTVLVTSQARLRISGEDEFVIGPLSAAAAGLFIDRALAVNRRLAIDQDLIARLCERLDGLPLAIELAAARTRHLSLADLSRQLDEGNEVLARGPADLPRRQESIQATVAWSYHLLDPAAQLLMRRLSVFSGWTLEQAEPLDALATLLDHSLVTVSTDTTCGTRYEMLDLVRAYAVREAAAHGETATFRAQHADDFLRLVRELEPLLRTTEQGAAQLRLDADLPNLRAAQRWLLTTAPSRALSLAGSLWMFWLWRGGLAEGRQWLADALAAGDGTVADRAKALWGAGWLAFHQGDVERTGTYSEELLQLADDTEDAVHRRNALTLHGLTDLAAGDFEAARASFVQAQQALNGTGERWLIATSALNIGTAELCAGDVTAAEGRFVDAAHQYAELGDQTYLYRADRHLGAAALVNGQLERAEQLFAAELLDEHGGTEWGMAESLDGLSWVAAVRGDHERAEDLTRDAADLRQRLGVLPHPLDVLLTQRFRGAPTHPAARRTSS